jgi:mono/diheme cytochrome c family protein
MALPQPVAALPATATAERGKLGYQQTCAACHGMDGKSISGFDLSTIASRMSVEQLVSWIADPKPPMPRLFSTPLSSDDLAEVTAIATYLRGPALGSR